MSSRRSRDGLSIGYRVGFRLRLIGLTVFGPAELGSAQDPKMQLEREREARVAAARAARAAQAARD
ncbi:MAG: hypothetical protein ABIS35_11815 [Terracoccus sp.]